MTIDSNEKNIKVTIVTPSFNQGQFIEDTISSVLNQSYLNIQYILVDGGSTDNTMEIVEKYRSRIDIIIHEKDTGQSDAINKGFKLADGDLIGWINSDDILYPDCVKNIVQLYLQNKAGAIFYSGKLTHIDKSGLIIKTEQKNIPHRNYLLKSNYDVVQPGSFYPASIVRKVNYLNESIHYCMDLDFWLRLMKFGGIYAYEGDALAAIRKWEETKTSKGERPFLVEIRQTLLFQGSSYFSKAVIRTYFYILKEKIKRILPSKNKSQ